MAAAKKLELIERKPLRGPHAIPSPNDWADWEERLARGEDPKTAAGERGLTCSNYRRADYTRQRELLDLSREARADEADRRLEKWVSVDDASDQLKTYWHRYHANRAGRVQEQVRVEGQFELAAVVDRSASLDDVARVLQAVGAIQLPPEGEEVSELIELSAGDADDVHLRDVQDELREPA